MFLLKLKIWYHIYHDLRFDPLVQKQFYILCYVLFYKFIKFYTRINKDDYFVLFLLFIFSFNVSLFRQLSIVYCSAVPRCSGVVPSFRRCSVVPELFRRSVGVPWCSSYSAGVPRSVVPCSSVPAFMVCRIKYGFPWREIIYWFIYLHSIYS